LCAVAAVAQTGSPGGQQSRGSSPGMGQQQPNYPSSQQPGTSRQPGTMGPSEQNTGGKTAGEKKLKGCVQSQGGQYVLETKKGKAVNLAGQDVSAHVGHEVAVKGNWESGGGAGMTSSSSTGKEAGAGKTFNVTSVDMISESCGGKGKGSSGAMGSSPSGSSGTNPSGTNPSGTNPPQ
jgi:hypothetical protein